jgi:hypothetical protein
LFNHVFVEELAQKSLNVFGCITILNFSPVCPCADKKVIAFNTRSKFIVSAAVKASLVAAVPAKISPIEASLSNTD